jgi:uncharacterized protein
MLHELYRGEHGWLAERTIFLTRHGSHAYGTSLPGSDLDVKGVAVPPESFFLGYLRRFEQAEQNEPDLVVYDLRKFFRLAAECNPNIIEVLWTDPQDHLLVTPLGRLLLEHRGDFLSQKARHTFSGYALAQLKRIQTHRRWLLHPPAEPPRRADHGLPEQTVIPKDQLAAAQSQIQKKLESWDVDMDALEPAARIALRQQLTEMLAEMGWSDEARYRAAARSLDYSDNFLMLLDRERQYRARMTEWQQFQAWKKNRNPARAELEARYTFDVKHAMHLVRLMRMCRELLETGLVQVRRPDAQELLAIRQGAWSYERLMGWAEQQQAEIAEAARHSPLPREPVRERLDELCQEIARRALADPEGSFGR